MSGRYERELVNTFDAVGMGALRAPSSGSATGRELPDVLAGRSQTEATVMSTLASATNDSVSDEAISNAATMLSPVTTAFGIESKNQQGTTLYVDSEEVEKLLRFCSHFGAQPRLSARFTEQRHPTEHYLLPPAGARITDEGNYGLPVSDIADRATEIVYPETATQEAKIEFVDSEIPTLEC